MGLFIGWSWPLTFSEEKSFCSSIPGRFGQHCFQICGNSLGKTLLFLHDFSLVHRSRSIKTWLDEFGVEELDWPAHRALTSTLLNIFGINWNEIVSLLTQHVQHLKSAHQGWI